MQSLVSHFDDFISAPEKKLWHALLALLIGALLTLCLPPYDLWIVGFICFPLLFEILHRSPLKGIYTGFLFGFGYFCVGLIWIGNALLVDDNPYRWAYPIAITGLPLILSIYPALACFIAKRFCNNSRLQLFIGLVGFYALSELLRGHLFTGFPWNLTGYVWSGDDFASILVSQTAAIGGIYFTSLLSAAWFLSPVLLRFKNKPQIITFMLCMVSVIAALIYGALRLQDAGAATTANYNVKIVQPNISQADKWNPHKQWSNLDTLLALSQPENPQESHTKTVIIWPETAISDYFLIRSKVRPYISAALSAYDDVTLVTGHLRVMDTQGHKTRSYYNSLSVFEQNMETATHYDKTRLVPFGEYIPFQKYIPIPTVTSFSGFKKGTGNHLINLGNDIQASGLVCYEIIFPNLIPKAQIQQSSVIINVTNDAWYGDSAGPHQHLAHAKFRAIETGKPIIRSANTGITAFTDPYGRITQKIPLNKKSNLTISASISAAKLTFFVFSGQILTISLTLILCMTGLFLHYISKAYLLRKR